MAGNPEARQGQASAATKPGGIGAAGRRDIGLRHLTVIMESDDSRYRFNGSELH